MILVYKLINIPENCCLIKDPENVGESWRRSRLVLSSKSFAAIIELCYHSRIFGHSGILATRILVALEKAGNMSQTFEKFSNNLEFW